MALVQARGLVFLALFVTLGGAFRHNLANIQEHLTALQAPPPDVAALRAEAENVISAKQAAAAAAQKAAMDALMGLGSATVNSSVDRDNNTVKRNATHDAVNAVHAANVEKKVASDVQVKVTGMIEACEDLFKFGPKQEEIKASAIAAQLEATTEHKAAHEELMANVIAAETADLSALVAKIAAIRAAQAEVDALDAEIGAGASAGVSGAAELVYSFAGELEARAEHIASTASFEAWPAMEAGDIKTEIGSKAQSGLQKALDHLQGAIDAHRATYEEALAQMQVIGGSTKQSNFTAMNELVQKQYEVNVAKSKAEALKAAVEHCIDLINGFFEEFDAYVKVYPVKMAAAQSQSANIAEQLATALAAADLSELAHAKGVFHFYHVMWARYAEAKAIMPADDEAYMALKQQLKATAQSVHLWINEEFMYLCEKHAPEDEAGSCRGARAKLIALLEKDNYWCDERGLETQCTTMKGGHQPNGKICKWITPSDEEAKQGIKGYCKQNNAPTKNLQYGRDHEGGAGLFY